MSISILPIRPVACVFDPRKMDQTGTYSDNGLTKKYPHDWQFRGPDYMSARKFGPVWNHLFQTGLTPPTDGKAAVLLTWTLPDLWGREWIMDNPASLPRIPDRWLVVRMMRRTHKAGAWHDEAPGVRCWIVDSGVTGGRAQVIAGTGPVEVGVVRSLAQAVAAPPDEPRLQLTPQGSGDSADLTFSAFMPANLGNLSFIDHLEGITEDALADSVLSYSVTGWYRRPETDDPLFTLAAAPPDVAREIAETLLPDDAAGRRGLFGARSLFSGLVAYVDYFNPHSYLGPAFGAPSPSGNRTAHSSRQILKTEPMRVGFGPSVEEAMAALCADTWVNLKEAERGHLIERILALLGEAFLHADESGPLLSEGARRASGFVTRPGRFVWEARLADERDGSEQDIVRLDAENRARLARLNEIQGRVDEATQQLESAAEEAYALWWLAEKERACGSDPEPFLGILGRLGETCILRREALKATEADLKLHREALEAALEADGLALRVTDHAPFHAPREPALAVMNLQPRCVRRPLRQSPRTERQTLRLIEGADAAALGFADIAAQLLEGLGDAPLVQVLRDLAHEAAQMEAATASLVRQNRPSSFGRAEERHAEAWIESAKKLYSVMAGAAVWPDSSAAPQVERAAGVLTGVTQDGVRLPLADLCSLWTQQPWMPVFLDWNAAWAKSPNAATQTYCGRTLLAHRPQRILADRLQKVRERFGTADSTEARTWFDGKLDEAAGFDVAGQSLSGFHQLLLGRNDALPRPLPVTATAPNGKDFSDVLPEAMLGAPDTGKLCTPYQEGTLALEELNIVDVFGQVLVLYKPVLATLDATRDRMRLPLRSIEPLRVNARFADAVSGWIVPSIVDDAIIVHDGSGLPLCMLCRSGGAIESLSLRAKSHDSRPALTDPALNVLVEHLRTASGFDALFGQVKHAGATRSKAGGSTSVSPASFLGTPLVLVRVSVGIERRGDACFDPNWVWTRAGRRTFIADRQTMTRSKRRAANPGGKARTIRLSLSPAGEAGSGLVCFWQGNEAPVWAVDATTGRPNDPSLPLPLPEIEAAAPFTVHALLDPLHGLALDAAILPAAKVMLDEKLYAEVLARLPAVLRMGPVLVNSHADLKWLAAPSGADAPCIDLPIPADRRGEADMPESAAHILIGGARLPVMPSSALPSVPEAEVAAAQGFLIV